MIFASISPVAFSIGSWPVHWYGLIIGSGVLLGLLLALGEAKRLGLNQDHYIDVVLYGFPLSIVGARLYFVAFSWDYYSQHPSEIMSIWNGGLAIHGGIITVILVGIVYCRYHKISFWNLADVAGPSILLGQAIGRWGNFINQEAHGGVIGQSSQWIIDLMPAWMGDHMFINGAHYHPTFLYESMWSLTGVIFLIFFLRRQPWIRRGEVFLSYLIWYSAGRIWIEGMRTDSLMLLDTFRIAQVISLATIIGAGILIYYRRKKGLANQAYGIEK